MVCSQACINLLKRTDENFSIEHAVSTIESWALAVTSSGDYAEERVGGDVRLPDGTALLTILPKYTVESREDPDGVTLPSRNVHTTCLPSRAGL